MSTLTDLMAYLEDLGLGESGVDLFYGARPDEPDTVTVLYAYSGGAPEYIQDSQAVSVEHPQIQVVVRAVAYATAEARIERVYRAFSFTNRTLGGTKYRSVKPNNTPGLLNRDTHDRVCLFFNATVEKEVSFESS